MHSGRSYKLSEFLFWTRRNLFFPIIVSVVSTALYQVLDIKWLAIPWTVVALLGTATAFIVGFKNLQTYNRMWEARKIWGAAMSASKSWAIMCRDLLAATRERVKELKTPLIRDNILQYISISNFFVKLFCFILPFGMIGEFDNLNEDMTGFLQGSMVLLVIPFSILISWAFTSLEQVGESTENPFEGSANDVPISQMCRAVEIDIREMLGERNLPEELQPQNNIILTL
jgi:predicted membrane chloride channel (bestrophin family)